MNKNKLLRGLVIFGDLLYIFWMLFNGLDDGFKDMMSVQAVSILALIILLALNIGLLSRKN